MFCLMRIKQVQAETHKGFKRYQTPFGKPLKTARGFYLPNYWTQKEPCAGTVWCQMLIHFMYNNNTVARM